MNRALLILLVVVVAAGYLGTLIARDPGYVLVAYDGFAMQTSLWVLLGLLLFITLVAYVLLRVTGVMRRAPAAYRDWRGLKKTQKAYDLTFKGQRLLAEGEYERARKFLDSGSPSNEAKALNFLAAARAADQMGDGAARESYLRQAEELAPEFTRAKNVVAAELAIARGEPEAALPLLEDAKLNEHILHVKQQAIQATGRWSDTLAALPEIRSADPAGALSLEKTAAISGLADDSLSDEDRHNLFRHLSAELKKDPGLIALYVRGLEDRDVVEPVLRAALKKSWDAELVALYGDMGDGSLGIRLKNAESWQKSHSTDPALQYCLGRIYEQSGEPSLAKECYARSVDLGGPIDATIRLAELMAAAGQFERSVTLYRDVIARNRI